MKQYYQLPHNQLFNPTIGPRPNLGDLNAIQESMRLATHKRLIADDEVPVGVSLSGGLDSSIVVALAKENKQQLDTFVVGYQMIGLKKPFCVNLL